MASTPDGRDYYAVLQVRADAHPEVVRAAYRTLLKALGNHPDLGGTNSQARTIIEAYKTLSNPERRQAYDQWLKAHSNPPAPAARVRTAVPLPSGLPPRLVRWMRRVLADHRPAPEAPFARTFDLVLESPGLLASRVYVKWYANVTRADWPTIFILCRAVAVGRHGFLPSADVVLFVAERMQELDAFLAEAAKHSAVWAWNRCVVGVCTLWPVRIHPGPSARLPGGLRRLRDSLGTGPDPLRGPADS